MLTSLVLAALLSSCGADVYSSEVNKPLASAEIQSSKSFQQVQPLVTRFAERNHFAVQPLVSQPQGSISYSMRLFRDDITILLTGFNEGTIRLSAYPLCACELGKRAGLSTAANEATSDLKVTLLK